MVNKHNHYIAYLRYAGWIDIFTRASYKIEITNALEYCQKNKGLRLFAWPTIAIGVTNHLHLVCQTDEPFKLSEFVRDFKNIQPKPY